MSVVVWMSAWAAGIDLQAMPQAGQGPTAPFDPTIEGVGVLGGVIDTLHSLPVVVAALLVLRAWPVLRRWWAGFGRRGDLLKLLATIGIVGALGVVATQQGFGTGTGGYGPFLGLGAVSQPGPGSDSPETLYITAAPGGPFGVFSDVTNPGSLPIRVEGVVEPGGSPWTSVWLAKDPSDYRG